MDRLDPNVFLEILTRPERLRTVGLNTRVAGSAAASKLKGRLPEVVDIRPVTASYDTAANRFTLAALDAALDIARRFAAAARDKRSPAMAANMLEAQTYARRLELWRRHRIFDGLAPATAFPLESTVLRGRSGYRELTRWYVDLLARSRRTDEPGIGRLLELRDASDVYEHWCFYEVVAAASRLLGRTPTLRPLPVDEWSVTLPWGYCADFGDVQIESNRSYSRPATSPPQVGAHSYSVRLRPDITVRAPGRFHLLDAKLKREIRSSFRAEDDDATDDKTATFKKADLYKMHAYRDALGASSVWILYPGDQGAQDGFPARWGATRTDAGPQGVGALALLPGERNEHLDALVGEMLGVAPPAPPRARQPSRA